MIVDKEVRRIADHLMHHHQGDGGEGCVYCHMKSAYEQSLIDVGCDPEFAKAIVAEDEGCPTCRKVQDIIAEFGDNPEQCLKIIIEYLDTPKGIPHSINADGFCNLGCC